MERRKNISFPQPEIGFIFQFNNCFRNLTRLEKHYDAGFNQRDAQKTSVRKSLQIAE